MFHLKIKIQMPHISIVTNVTLNKNIKKARS